MEHNPKENINLHALLETYSIEEISQLFSEVDKKIVSLHQVSSEDFLKLNKDFKMFHQQASQIAQNASFLFDYITGHDNNRLIEDINEFYHELKSKSDHFNENVNLVSHLINQLLSRLRQSFFPIKNFKQNLTSLKFLESNLELNASLSEDHKSPGIQAICSKLGDHVTQIEKTFARLKQLIKDKFLLSEHFNAEKMDIDTILELLKDEIEVYSKHYHSAKEKLPEIKASTDATSNSISKIITNLQYQDIIKQKMEHIQQTHKALLDELGKFNGEDKAGLHEKAKYFIRLRDISGLQAAQLMHTNKEYQTAIERISDKFLEIGEHLTLVSKQCAEYTSFDAEKQKIFFNSLKSNLMRAEDQIQHFCKFTANFQKNVDDIIGYLDQIITRYDQINPLMEDMRIKIEDISTNNGKSGTNLKILRQMTQVFDDLKGNGKIMDDLFEAYRKQRAQLKHNVSPTLSRSQENQCQDFPGKIASYLSNLSEMEENIVSKLSENNVLSDKVFQEVQRSVNEIKYYDYFEKEIGSIIDELNSLNFNLKRNSEDEEAEGKIENLEKLKEYYTMNTEHTIHSNITNGIEADIEVEEEGGDLELF